MLFKRVIKVQIHEKIFEYPNLNIGFTYNSMNDDSTNQLLIYIDNLSKTTISDLKVGQGVLFNFGYGDDVGTLCEGYVKEVATQGFRTTIKVTESIKAFKEDVSVYYGRYVQASYIIKDICSKASIALKQVELLEDYRYPGGYCSDSSAIQQIKNIVAKANSQMTIKNNRLYIYNKNSVRLGNIILDYTSGLLEEPRKAIEEDANYEYDITSLPIHYIKKGDIIQIESRTFNGIVKIIEFSIDNFVANYKVGEVKWRFKKKFFYLSWKIYTQSA